MGKTADKISEIATPIVEENNLELVDVEFVKEGGNWFLRVFIEDLKGETSLDDCETVSRLLGEELDRLDPIEQSYVLEVSSPGIERQLKKLTDYDRFKGKLSTIKTYAPIDGKKEITGTILRREGDDIYLQLKGEDKVITIPFNSIANAHLTFNFQLI